MKTQILWLFVVGCAAVCRAAHYPNYYAHAAPALAQCPAGPEPGFPDPLRPGVFEDLSMAEIQAVYTYLLNAPDLGVRPTDLSTQLNQTWVTMMELLMPPKAEVKAYLRGERGQPGRYARATLARGDLDPPIMEDYKVGPLPAVTGHEKLQIFGRDSAPYGARFIENWGDIIGLGGLWARVFARINPIIRTVTGYSVIDCGDRCLNFMPGFPGRWAADDRSIWWSLMRGVEGFYLHSVGLEVRTDVNSLQPEDWRVDYVIFMGQRFSDIDDFVNRYQIPDNPDPYLPVNDRNLYSSMNFRGTPEPEARQRGPRSYMPDGRRFSVQDGRHVTWQGWDLHFALRTESGLNLYNVLFKGESIAYEVSPSEIGVVYSGGLPQIAYSVLSDSAAFLGAKAVTLVPGIDCPERAAFFSFAHFSGLGAFEVPNTVCVFEQDREIPLRRHTEQQQGFTQGFTQGMPGNVLVVRAILVIGNYDYIVDYVLHQNGVLEVRPSLAGYIQAQYRPDNVRFDKYGYTTGRQSTGPVHTHLLHWKVDMDILGENNRFQTVNLKTETMENPYEPGTNWTLQVLEEKLANTEKEAALRYNFDTPKYYVMMNENEKNSHNVARGYRIIPTAMAPNIVPSDGWASEKGMSWTRYQVAVTRHKDAEPRGSSVYNMMESVEPVANFQSFIDDDENIVDQDLVAWVTLGTVHIPHSEDAPVIQSPGVSLSFFLAPFNFFDEDPSLASRDNIRVTTGADGQPEFERAGVEDDVTCIPRDIVTNPMDTTMSSVAGTSAGWASVTTCLLTLFSMAIFR